MTVVVPNGQASAAAVRAATISDVKDGMNQLNAAVQNYSASDGDVGDVADKTQRQQIIDAAHKVLNAVKRPDDVWVDSQYSKIPSGLSSSPLQSREASLGALMTSSSHLRSKHGDRSLRCRPTLLQVGRL